MKVDFTTEILDLSGKPIQPQNGETLTARAVAISGLQQEQAQVCKACGNQAVPGPPISPDEKLLRFSLALRIQEKDSFELTADEVTLIKKQVALFYTSLVYGRMVELLDPAALKNK